MLCSRFSLPLISLLVTGQAVAEKGTYLDQVKGMAGCYIVDYNYSENEVLDSEYSLDPRVYDASKYIVKELVRVVDESASMVRLQHFMQAESFDGDVLFMMRHHGEVWQQAPDFRYRYEGRFDGNDHWALESLDGTENQWVRAITNLDDGLRYQCLGSWTEERSYSQFECKAFSPIPGRETRDMGRTDYNTMQRSTQVALFGQSWLEKQKNIKVDFSRDRSRELAGEVGKIWSVRVPDEECATVSSWADERQAFWDILAQAWDEAYDGSRPFKEIKYVDGSTRGQKISQLLEEYYLTIASNPNDARLVRDRLSKIIEAHRE